MKYFSKLPLVNYNGQSVRNLLAKAQLTPETKRSTTIFYPYTMRGEDRADVLSYKYYDNADYTWLIWMANEVIDPYYDLPLSEDDFQSFIIKKYGSTQTAQSRIKFWRNDWSDDDSMLTVDQYNALPCYLDEANNIQVNAKKYFNPNLDIYGSIYGYSRKQDDWTVTTNRTAAFSCTITSGTFIEGERIKKNTSNYGYVAHVTQDQMTVQHIMGSFANTDVLEGAESGAQLTITSTPYVQITIPNEELFYWSPVSFYDHENELNEAKKEIVLIDNRYKQNVEDELARVFRS